MHAVFAAVGHAAAVPYVQSRLLVQLDDMWLIDQQGVHYCACLETGPALLAADIKVLWVHM